MTPAQRAGCAQVAGQRAACPARRWRAHPRSAAGARSGAPGRARRPWRGRPRGRAARVARTGRRPRTRPWLPMSGKVMTTTWPGVAGVRADLLVARLRGVDDEVATAAHGRPEGDARGRRCHPRAPAGRAAAADARVDDGLGRQRQDSEVGRQGRSVPPCWPHRTVSPASRDRPGKCRQGYYGAAPRSTRRICGPMTSTQPAYCLAVG